MRAFCSTMLKRFAVDAGALDRRVLHDVAQGTRVAFCGHVPGCEVQMQRRTAAGADSTQTAWIGPPVGDSDVDDRRGRRRHAVPQAEYGQRLLRAAGYGRGAAVAGLVALLRRIEAVDHHDIDAGFGQGDGEGKADHAAAGDQHFHVPVPPSILSGHAVLLSP